MATKLEIYKGALRYLGERTISQLSDPGLPRRTFDNDYDACLAWCAEQAQWNHAKAVAMLNEASEDDPSPIGWDYAYDLPADWGRMFAASITGNFFDPFNGFEIRGRLIYCNAPTLWIKYISSDYGVDLTLFSEVYSEFVACALASRNCLQITKNRELSDRLLKVDLKKALSKAKNLDAMNNPSMRMPQGTWTRARHLRRAGEG